MKAAFKRQIIELLDQHRIMSVATNRPDGWPQATIVGYANDGLVIYCFIARDSQKFANLSRDPRISLSIGNDVRQPLQIRGLSMAARAELVEDRGEVDHAHALLLQRYPEYKIMPQPDPAVPLYVCGESYSHDQGWAEGALDTAEQVVRKLGLDAPAWLAPANPS